ncbi:DUF2975 domain-containing protein [Arthrobacter sp. zg-Y916]|uniref:DUF2975 domain-containing protein n=1 Tax=Arthrobacter sp. zg-Y916 TaxID=2894190 RepID=UPI001E32CF63|nr:DUF2975 domain-containing protein [Arthrobacter sp. zg-Y916]MCC9193715.1 DUF2975 domain-containing protein [Arthrobacter sp. zg-Y916]
MNPWLPVFRRVLLPAVFLFVLLLQTMGVPFIGGELADEFPEYAYLLPPYLTVVSAGFVCMQVAVAAAWSLAGLASRGRLYTAAAVTRTAIMAAASGTATVLALLLAGHLHYVVGEGNPASLFAFGSAILAGLACTVLSISLRGRLLEGRHLETSAGPEEV